MSMTDDLCDFCGAYVDPIGCDTARMVGPDSKLWDGQCYEGMQGQWQDLDDAALTVLANVHDDAYQADPIDWDKPMESTPEEYQHRAKQLYHQDTAWQIRSYLSRRHEETP